jgi:cytochrome oxidase Cu insertion factor (SCO1/SenC/PrrC family)
VTDDDSGSGLGTTTVAVRNVPPVVDAGTFQTVVFQGLVSTSPGSFTDVGTQDTDTGKVDYGDGTGTTTLTLNSGKTFDLSHVYACKHSAVVALP